MRDSKGRFKSRGLLVTLPSVNLLINYLVFLFIILPWIYVGLKFNIVEKVKELLNIIFFDDSKCNCNGSNGDNKY